MVAEIGINLDNYQPVEKDSYEGYSEMTSPRLHTMRLKESNNEIVRHSNEELLIRR